jgi:hypothetical protein
VSRPSSTTTKPDVALPQPPTKKPVTPTRTPSTPNTTSSLPEETGDAAPQVKKAIVINGYSATGDGKVNGILPRTATLTDDIMCDLD